MKNTVMMYLPTVHYFLADTRRLTFQFQLIQKFPAKCV
jgi:hypothetical protein